MQPCRFQPFITLLLAATSSIGATSDRNLPIRIDLRPSNAVSSLKVENVRLESPPPTGPLQSAVLKFELVNESVNRLTDVVLQLSVVEKQQAAGGLPRPRVLVAPFTIRGAVVLESGYRIDYEVLLRNLSADCACVATVEAMSARSLPK